MLYALEHPVSLLVLLASFVVGITLHGWTQALVADRMHASGARREGRLVADPRRHVDPFGAVGAALSGLGWVKPVPLPDRGRRGAVVAVALVGPAVNLVLGVGLLLAWRFAYNPHGLSRPLDSGAADVLQRGLDLSGHVASGALLLAGASQLYLGLLSLVPIPPLDGGRLLLALGPRTIGWQKAQFHLVEQNIGIVVLLVLLVLPLRGGLLLPNLLDTVLKPVLRLLLGG